MQLFHQIWRGNFSRVRIHLYHDGTELKSNRQTMLGARVFKAGDTVDFLLQLESQKWGSGCFHVWLWKVPGRRRLSLKSSVIIWKNYSALNLFSICERPHVAQTDFQTYIELQDATMNMNTDVECTKATNLELKVMLVLLNASDEWQWKLWMAVVCLSARRQHPCTRPLYKIAIKPWL